MLGETTRSRPLLEQRRRAEFWAALEAETPDQEYLADTEEYIARFEAAG